MSDIDSGKKIKSTKSDKSAKSTKSNKSDKSNTSIFIFHRAIRLDDNMGLLAALMESSLVLPIFIFTPEQITDQNRYRSIAAIRFMIDALIDLNNSLKKIGSKLHFFYGEQHKVLESIITDKHLSKLNINRVYINQDYTPYSIKRENSMIEVCEKHNIDIFGVEDYLLLPINTVKNGTGSFYSVYTPFYRNAVKHKVAEPVTNRRKNFVPSNTSLFTGNRYSIKIQDVPKKMKVKLDIKDIQLPNYPGTRSEGLKRLSMIKNHKKYSENRDNLTMNTTLLSPYIKFGIVSPREVYHKIKDLFGIKHSLISQLFWREFYYNIAYNRPEVLQGKSFRPSYDKIVWKKNAKLLEKWKTGTTGVPIIDAAMRELVNSNYMHNRGRLITSNYLVKHYLIDWREGEKFYAEHLVDYDPAVNNGNWQWSAGSGADAQPYFRMMNPWSQSIKHDPDCIYIKKWIPELADVPPDDIHDWQNRYSDYAHIDYPKPYLEYDFNLLKKSSKAVYKNVSKPK